MAIPAANSIIQMAWVVADLDEAMLRWFRVNGTGPFLVNRHIKVGESCYRGRAQAVDFSVAMAQAGGVQVELIQQHDASPSHYRDTVPPGAEAFHHVAILPDDYDAAVHSYVDQGFAIAGSGIFGDVRFSYVDTTKATGHMVEIVEDLPSIRRFFGAVRKAAEEWDRNPATLVRNLS